MATRLIPKFLVTPSPRLYYLRAVVALSAITIWFAVWLILLDGRPIVAAIPLVVTCTTFTHHLGTAFGPDRFPIPIVTDLALSASEIICDIFLMGVLIIYVGRSEERLEWFPKRAVFGLCVFCALTLALVILFALKCFDLACSPAGTICDGKVDIRRSCSINPDELEDSPSALEGWRYVAGALFGRKPWKENIPGESKWIRNVRGTATVVVVLVLAIYGAYKVILKPIAEKGMIPSHDFRAFVLPGNFKTSRKVVYNLIVAWDTQQDAPEALFDAVSVDATPTLERPTPAPCAKAHTDSLNSSLPSSYQALIFQCTQQEWKSYSLHRLVRDRSLRSPSLQLRVDFSGLRTGNRSLSEGVDFTDDSLQIWLGFTDDIADVTNATAPLPLFPGANLLTAFHYSIRQKLKPASLATAGFEMYSTFLTPSFVYTVPNPLITATTPNVSTLRIVPAFQPGELVIQQDFRNHSVLNGLSALGGLGTFLSTLFVIILGRGLMQTMRGRKPYSPFGLFHKTSREQGIIKEKCSTRYPKIAQEVDAFTAKATDLPGAQHHSERGVVAFLLDALIDLEGLGFEHGRPEGNHTVGTHAHGHGQGEDVEGKIEGSHTG